MSLYLSAHILQSVPLASLLDSVAPSPFTSPTAGRPGLLRADACIS